MTQEAIIIECDKCHKGLGLLIEGYIERTSNTKIYCQRCLRTIKQNKITVQPWNDFMGMAKYVEEH